MTKITLDDTEYESENFDEEQQNILQEIQYNSNVKNQIEYQLHSITTLGSILVERLKKSLESNA
tara:strand:- start:280 stop:471 length:192 start_codon:yes stop_codon:yes gene_type:complete